MGHQKPESCPLDMELDEINWSHYCFFLLSFLPLFLSSFLSAGDMGCFFLMFLLCVCVYANVSFQIGMLTHALCVEAREGC